MRIGQVAERAGVSTKTIRYYEEIGLLPQPARSGNGYRQYEEDAVDRLGFIHDARVSGLTLGEIRSILTMRDAGESTCGHVIELLEQHIADIDVKIRKLTETQTKLRALTNRARRLDPAGCTNPHRCQTIAAGETPDEGTVSIGSRLSSPARDGLSSHPEHRGKKVSVS